MNESKVYVVQEPLRFDPKVGRMVYMYDLTPATKYGELMFLMESGEEVLNTVPAVRSMRNKLRNFSDHDYILPSGDPTAIAMAASIAASVNAGKFRILKWDKKIQQYITISVDSSGRVN